LRRALRGAAAIALAVAAIEPRAASAARPRSKAASAKAACLAAHEEGLALRTQKKPHAAHDKFVSCARSECPVVVRKECAEQLTLAEKDAPTVALEARDESGLDAPAVKVAMDGAPLTERLTGTAVPVEPGEHVFRFEAADGKVIEQRVLVVEGDKNRKVLADFATLVPKPIGPDRPVPPPRPPLPVASLALAGVTVVGLASFTVFAITGKNDEKDLASSCGPRCSDDEVGSVKTKYAVADVSLVVAVAAAAVAVVLAWPSITGGAPRASTALGPAPWLPHPEPAGRP
jgi:hypothetical protein